MLLKKIRDLNLLGTPWATSACRGKPLLYFYEGWNFNSGNYLFTTDTK